MKLDVMTFNLRLDVAVDGRFAWRYRQAGVGAFLRRTEVGLCGLQEVLPHMGEALLARLPSTYRLFGEPRQVDDEATPILYDTNRLTLLDGGTFWLSETPSIVGSKDPDAGCIRIATWADFAFVAEPTLRFTMFNTHLDHLSSLARTRGVSVVMDQLVVHHARRGYPLVLTGDFNDTLDASLFKVMAADNAHLPNAQRLIVVASATQPAHLPTFHGFSMRATRAIDYIFTSRCVGATDYCVHQEAENGVPLSDHHPLSVKLDFSFCNPPQNRQN